MVSNCVVSTCSSTARSRGRVCKPEGVRFHRFPTVPDRIASWINNIRAVNGSTWEPTHVKSARICSLHFAPAAYELKRVDGVIKLKWNAVPTVFLRSKSDAPLALLPSTRTRGPVQASRIRHGHDRINARRKVFKSILNDPIPDHVYAAPEPAEDQLLPTPTVSHEHEQSDHDDVMVRFPTLRDEDADDDMVRFPTLRVERTEDCEVINLDDDSSEEGPAQQVQGAPQNPMKTSVVNGNLVLTLNGVALAQFTGVDTLPERAQARNSFSDSEIDKLQIKRLTDENRRLQEELDKIRRYAEKLLTQNARLKQQNMVTSRAYRDIKNQMKRANENLNNPFSDDESILNSREEGWNQELDDDAVVSGTKSGSAVYKDVSLRKDVAQQLPYTSVLKLQKPTKGAGKSGDMLKLLTAYESPQNDSLPDGCDASTEVVNV